MKNNHILFQPYHLNDKLILKNRFVMAPMTTWSGNEDGTISSDELKYYHYRSAGAGMVITATTYAEPSGKGFVRQFYAGDDSTLPSLKQLADAIKSAGAKAILQVFHAGRKANPKDMPEGVTLSASGIAAKREDNNVPRAMTQAEIQHLIKSFKDVVFRAHKAGFDGVEIHGANTYLLQQFFSPHSNRRTDQWGGNVEKRMRLPLALVDACLVARDEIKDDNFIVGYRFSPEENSEPGITLEDTSKLVVALCETGLDYLHVSLGDYKQTSMRVEDDKWILSQIVAMVDGKKPLIGVGQVYTFEAAEGVLNEGADLVALGRQLLVDGKTIEKWQEGQLADKYYNVDFQKQQCMPKPLHDVIVNRGDWLPLSTSK